MYPIRSLTIITALVLCSIATSAMSIRGTRGLNNKETETVLCRVVTIETLFETEDGESMYGEEDPACVPIVDGEEKDDLVPLSSLPADVRERLSDENDLLLLSISDAEYSERNGEISITSQSQYSILDEVPEHLRHLQERRLNPGTGDVTFAIVRVSTQDSTPSMTKAELTILMNPSNVNFISQFDKCSMGKLRFKKESQAVIDVKVDQPIADFGTKGGGNLASAAQSQIKADFGVDSILDIADKILFCIPPGTGNWVAAAPMNHWRATFNDRWVASLSATMHELGHSTCALPHSNENGVKYGDSTGYMSKSYRWTDGPFRCFNGQQNDRLGWYDPRKLTFDPTTRSEPTLIRLAAFVHYEDTTADEPVLVNVADAVYLQYNLAESFNSGTGELANMVTITERSSSGSELLGGLDAGFVHEIENFKESGETLVMKACQVEEGGGDNPTVMVISIGMGETNCGEYKREEEAGEKEVPMPVVTVHAYMRDWINTNRP